MEFIRSIDIFGAQFNFTIFGKANYNTYFGGFLSIFILIASIIISLMFGQDLFFKTNPKDLIERIVPKNYTYMNATVQNFPIFWRIADDNANPVNFTNILYPDIILYFNKFNKTTGVYDLIDKKRLLVKLCTRSLVNNDVVYDQWGLDLFYCLDWTDAKYPIGGFWDDSDIVYYMEKTIYSCPNDNKTSPNCTKPAFIKQWLGQSLKLYYQMIYPKVFFTPGNYSKPVQVSYINYFQLLSANLYKKNRYFFTQAESSSDKGWIFQDIDTYNAITYDSSNSDFDYKSDADILNPLISSSMYATTIYLMKNHNKYNLSYMKVQDLAAQVGGFMKIIMVFCFVISFHLNEFSRDVDVMKKLFEFENDEKDKNNDNTKLFEKSSMSMNELILKRKTSKILILI